MISQMPNPSVQTKHLSAEEELVMVKAAGSFKSRTVNKHSVIHTRGPEDRPIPSGGGISSLQVPSVISSATVGRCDSRYLLCLCVCVF